ncbi:hypothetical protein NL676_035302 [Syzygium grande]|nr:hypothetical protein NL676_035302 [Syzygium grande]
MATPVKILVLAFVMLLVRKGNCQCSADDIDIVQSRTGAIVKQKPEWNVTISLGCPCIITNINLAWPGFRSVGHIDPLVLEKMGDECLINGGRSVRNPIGFSYTWDESYPFKIAYFKTVWCSVEPVSWHKRAIRANRVDSVRTARSDPIPSESAGRLPRSLTNCPSEPSHRLSNYVHKKVVVVPISAATPSPNNSQGELAELTRPAPPDPVPSESAGWLAGSLTKPVT